MCIRDRCGCALRIARELFSFLPLSRVAVHVQTDVLALLLRDLSGRDPDHDLHQGGHQGDAEVKTTLLEGSVAVNAPAVSSRITLSPGESAIYNRADKTPVSYTHLDVYKRQVLG